ncbi:hypothetical protein [Streptomyces sp. NPDC048644]
MAPRSKERHDRFSDSPRGKLAVAAVGGVCVGAARAVIAWLLAQLGSQG